MKKTDFDNLLKSNILTTQPGSTFGYKTADGKTYDNYDSNPVFDNFKKDMEANYPDFFKSYAAGKGSELKEKNGRYGLTPPKMASVASSSRFCYLALRNGAGALGGTGKVCVEYDRPINQVAGIAPQLDAFIPDSNIYVEVKCHEIFDSHKIEFRSAYWDWLYGQDNAFGFETKVKTQEDSFEIPLSVFGIEGSSSKFDIKQLLCHLMGIASRSDVCEKATLVYLFFKPKVKDPKLEKAVEDLFKDLKKEIKAIFSSAPIKAFTEKYNIELQAVAEYAEQMEDLRSNNMEKLF